MRPSCSLQLLAGGSKLCRATSFFGQQSDHILAISTVASLQRKNWKHQRSFSTSHNLSNGFLDSVNDFYQTVARSPITATIGEGFCTIHDTSGLSWTTSIFISSFAIRFLVTLPAHTTSQKVIAKRAILYESMEKVLIPALRRAMAIRQGENRWSEPHVKKLFGRKQKELYQMEVIKRNCAASKIYLPLLLQIPLWITATVSIRNLSTGYAATRAALPMADQRLAELSSQGFGWVPDLTLPDSTWILPVTIGFLFLLNNELAASGISKEAMKKAGKKWGKGDVAFTILMRSLCLVMIPVTSNVPSGMALYWTASAAAGTAVHLVMISPKYRKAVRIPETPGYNSPTPYRDRWANLKANTKDSFMWIHRLSKK